MSHDIVPVSHVVCLQPLPQISARVPSRYEKHFAVAGLKPTNLTLTLELHVQEGLVHEVVTKVSANIHLKSSTLEGSFTLSIKGTSTAVLHIGARRLKIFELLMAVVGDKLSSQLKSNGFTEMEVDYVSMDIAYGSSHPLLAIFHLEIASMKNFAKVMFSKGPIGRISSKIHLDKIFSHFDIRDINVTIILQAKKLSMSLFGHPTIPKLKLTSEFELTLGNIGAGVHALRSLKLVVCSFAKEFLNDCQQYTKSCTLFPQQMEFTVLWVSVWGYLPQHS